MLAKRDKAKVNRTARRRVREVMDDTRVPKTGHPGYRRQDKPDGAAVSARDMWRIAVSRRRLIAEARNRDARPWIAPLSCEAVGDNNA